MCKFTRIAITNLNGGSFSGQNFFRPFLRRIFPSFLTTDFFRLFLRRIFPVRSCYGIFPRFSLISTPFFPQCGALTQIISHADRRKTNPAGKKKTKKESTEKNRPGNQTAKIYTQRNLFSESY